ncbi:acetyl-CoA C-acetyltransferase [Quadrisphaera setariae]|uniref:Acetyl-CoA C-acetyltransferase n=1 Tax=Quadrisphaera setariae TaxID=2593304 RepID=A0A5C8ZIN2_9ACTN|nr:acetyl-CoA C-acetyltransferase [Quadrisphaera setariae]TXR56730.1 acetyl-CoA C-acetyltransferase [Quadrisphaera setariae]
MATSNAPAPASSAPPTPGPGLRDAVVVAADRTPFSRAGRAYARASSQDLLAAALDGLTARTGLAGQRLGTVVAGSVLRHSTDLNLTREALLSSALAPTTPTTDLSMACATGLEAAVIVANAIRVGQVESGIAGGADSASDAPLAVGDDLRRTLLAARAARSAGQRLKALAGLRPSALRVDAPRNAEPRTGLSMGEHAALTAAAWGVSRAAQDGLAARSHQALARAWDEGFFDDLVTSCLGLRRDDVLRPSTTVEALAALKPVFGRDLPAEQPGAASMTAGNSTPLTDGAAVVLLASREWAAAHQLPVLARVVDAESAAVDFVTGTDGLLTAPVYAMPRLLDRIGWTLQDADVLEVHEAFASTVLATLAAWESEEFCRERLGRPALGAVDRTRLNPVGSSLATGHPFAATGGRVLATAAKQLHQLAQQQGTRGAGAGGKPRALISVCAAGGQGVVMALEAA